MKQCFRCRTLKSVDDFNVCTKNASGLHSYCRTCQSAHYRENRERHVRNVRRSAAARRSRMRDVIAARFREGCVDCGASDFRILEFDHVRGVKTHGISHIVRVGLSIETLETELAKCEVRCRNCHAIATANRRVVNWFDEYSTEAWHFDT